MDQVYLNDFLFLAEELQIKGLSGTSAEGFKLSDNNKQLENTNVVNVSNFETFQKGLTNDTEKCSPSKPLSDTKEIITKEISRVETQELTYVTPSEIAELNEKFKDNPMKKQQETMKLYSKRWGRVGFLKWS